MGLPECLAYEFATEFDLEHRDALARWQKRYPRWDKDLARLAVALAEDWRGPCPVVPLSVRRWGY